MPLFTTGITSSLNPDVEKYKFLHKGQDRNEYYFAQQIIERSSSDYLIVDYSSIKSYGDEIKEEIKSISEYEENWDSFGAMQISSTVINNTINIVDSIFPSLLEKLNKDDIYPSKYGTIILEWIFDANNIFSLEVGRETVGYFYEIAGDISKQVDSLPIGNDDFHTTTYQINTDLFVFA